MTEKEAIENLQSYGRAVNGMIDYCKNFELKTDISSYLDKKETFDIAIKALEEIQRYRAIGTVEEFRKMREIRESPNDGMYSIKNYGETLGVTGNNRTLFCDQKSRAARKYFEVETYIQQVIKAIS